MKPSASAKNYCGRREARDEAEHQVRLKDEFLATLSHELRTPMNAMLGGSRSSRRTRRRAGIGARLEIIDRNARAQAKLIEDLLDMNRLMTGNVQLELEPVDLAVLAEATVQTLRPTADAKTVRLTNDVSNSASLVNGDGRRLQQVLWNLVHNAVKFTPAGGHVVVGVQASDDAVRLVVTDSGCGISSAFLPYVFERFRQEDPRPRGNRTDSASGSRLHGTSRSCTAGRFGPRAPVPGSVPPSCWNYRAPRPLPRMPLPLAATESRRLVPGATCAPRRGRVPPRQG